MKYLILLLPLLAGCDPATIYSLKELSLGLGILAVPVLLIAAVIGTVAILIEIPKAIKSVWNIISEIRTRPRPEQDPRSLKEKIWDAGERDGK